MRLALSPIYLAMIVCLVVACATSEPEVDGNDDSNQGFDVGEDTDSGHDVADGDADVDADVDGGDPDECEGCEDHEQCVAGVCVDLCEDQQLQCGQWEIQGHSIDCGTCPAGDCDEGVCPDICEVFSAQCGSVYWNGVEHACGQCSGIDRCVNSQCTASEGFIDIVAGSNHSCGLRPNGEVRCWGRNSSGQLGNNDMPNNARRPQRVRNLNTAATLSSRNNHGCSVRTDEHVYCWGSNGSGRLGDGTTDNADSAVRATGVTATAVAAGGEHTCALLPAQKVLCWGDNAQGQLGTGQKSSNPSFDFDKRRTRYQTGEEFDQVIALAAGSGHNCGVRSDNTLWCWGLNTSGQLGRGDNFDAPAYATQVSSLDGVGSVTSGHLHTCAITAGGELWCWGRGSHGQIGDGGSQDRYSPTEVELSHPVIDVATGQFHTCAATVDGQVYCWGRNQAGQLGQGFTSNYIADPMEVGGLSNIHRVVAGTSHSCALDRDGQAYCWGNNADGQVGNDSDDPEFSLPQEVD